MNREAQLLFLTCPSYPWSILYNTECYAKNHHVPFLESLVWFDLRFNPSFPDQTLCIYT